jgi:peptidoglycan/xylan/chitin deacetylase (PgdA/CDA1 family)
MPPPNPQRQPWPNAIPNVQQYSQRDFGNRVGHYRLMELLDKYNLRGSVSLNIALCDHHPEIIEECMKRDWEFFSHGIYNTRYSYGLTPQQEQSVLADSIRTVEKATGNRIRGYLAPALTHTENTLDLIADNDFWYSCDLFQDDQPQPLKTKTGKLVSMPYSLEVNDVITYSVNGWDPDRYTDTLKRHFDQLLYEGERSGTVMCIPLHAYLVSQPNRIKVFEKALQHICAHKDDVWFATGQEIAKHFRDNYWDQSITDIQTRGVATGGVGFAPKAGTL